MEYISIPCEKILALAGFESLPVEAKISEAHALPSELAGLGLIWGYRPVLTAILKPVLFFLSFFFHTTFKLSFFTFLQPWKQIPGFKVQFLQQSWNWSSSKKVQDFEAHYRGKGVILARKTISFVIYVHEYQSRTEGSSINDLMQHALHVTLEIF